LNSLTTNKTTPSFSLGGTTQSGASSSLTPQTGTSSLGLSLASASSTTAAAPTATGVSLTSATPSTSSVLASSQQTTNSNTSITYKVLEDYINKWMGDLEAQEKDFLNQATQLNALDKLMMDNGEKVFYKLIQSFHVKKAIGTYNIS
jgi:nuclear pore complex protein Nup62